MTMTQWWAPTIVRVSGDSTIRGQLIQTTDGGLLCDFPDRLFLIANHQIYTDWLYLWWVGYAAGMHGRIYVVLKESLKSIPVIGWGMQFAQFIFLKRKWEQDKPNLAVHMQRFNNKDPMWLMLFPEGTNLASCTREKSRQWAKKNKLNDLQHCLLPRSTGLQFMLKELRDTVEYVYDCTIAYEGVPRGQYAQDIFTVGVSYFGGRPPKSVNMYWRRFRVADIPLDNPAMFEFWLRARWAEKDKYIEHYYRTGRLPADTGTNKDHTGKTLAGAGYIESEVKPKRWYEFLQVFAPIGLFSLILYFFYGALPPEIIKKIASIDHKTLIDQVSGIEKGKIKIPETKDLMATAPQHLQNRFDAVRKIAQARGTTPEQVIAQLQTISPNEKQIQEGKSQKQSRASVVPKKATKPSNGPSSQSAVKPLVSKPASSVKGTVTKAKPTAAGAQRQAPKNPTKNADPGPRANASTAKSDTGPGSLNDPKPAPATSVSKAIGKAAPKMSTATKKIPTKFISSRPSTTPAQAVQKPAVTKASNTHNPQEAINHDDVRKARKKLEVRQGKQELKRKTRRIVEQKSAGD